MKYRLVAKCPECRREVLITEEETTQDTVSIVMVVPNICMITCECGEKLIVGVDSENK